MLFPYWAPSCRALCRLHHTHHLVESVSLEWGIAKCVGQVSVAVRIGDDTWGSVCLPIWHNSSPLPPANKDTYIQVEWVNINNPTSYWHHYIYAVLVPWDLESCLRFWGQLEVVVCSCEQTTDRHNPNLGRFGQPWTWTLDLQQRPGGSTGARDGSRVKGGAQCAQCVFCYASCCVFCY